MKLIIILFYSAFFIQTEKVQNALNSDEVIESKLMCELKWNMLEEEIKEAVKQTTVVHKFAYDDAVGFVTSTDSVLRAWKKGMQDALDTDSTEKFLALVSKLEVGVKKQLQLYNENHDNKYDFRISLVVNNKGDCEYKYHLYTALNRKTATKNSDFDKAYVDLLTEMPTFIATNSEGVLVIHQYESYKAFILDSYTEAQELCNEYYDVEKKTITQYGIDFLTGQSVKVVNKKRVIINE